MITEVNEKMQLKEVKEIVKSYCVSSLGKNRFDRLTASSNVKVVSHRYQETKEARTILEAKLTMPFMGLTTIDHLFSQLEKGMILEAGDLVECADFLRSGRMIRRFMEKHEDIAPSLALYARSINEFINIEDAIYQAIKNGQVASEASRNLGKVRRLINENETKIEERLNKFLKNKTNQPKIQEFFVSQKNQRFTIPIKASYKNQIEGTIIETSTKGTTVFMEPTSVTKLNDERYLLQMEESTEIYQILATLSGMLLECLTQIKLNIEVIAEYDMIFARAKYSRSIQGVTPKLNREGRIKLIQAKHPLLGKAAVPLNFSIGTAYRGLIITGPNAGGKTVVLKTVGLLAMMSMYGIQLPVAQGSEIALFDQILIDIGDSQSLENALSTFSSHIQNIALMMQKATKNSLVLFDEIGSGTEPNEGAGLAIAILEEFYQKGCLIVATTHYGEIKRYSEQHPDFMNAAMAFNQETLTPLYQLIIGKSGDSNALWIAKKMALKPAVIEKAQAYIANKDYDLTKKNFSSKKSQPQQREESSTKQVNYQKGDKVLLLDAQEEGLVYEQHPLKQTITVFCNGEMHEILPKRLKRLLPATTLYPIDYDLETLFTSYTERKLTHDIERGSKKALKKIFKEMKKEQTHDS
ncbi:endonuclease MutS2 [Isobaculum melis]|uniref:DsDNA-specific endonuclease/ATPase MutS2 n=1 Tax=Isobaculum melis TaxID=142588 RepID=A0A1H9SUS1_9LACT|nr:mannonate oxidoreductase [Isobaculum melis]SER88143.1 dsDNA-specific endonuclease/ATPase MutS2 [Isobaculum melis]